MLIYGAKYEPEKLLIMNLVTFQRLAVCFCATAAGISQLNDHTLRLMFVLHLFAFASQNWAELTYLRLF